MSVDRRAAEQAIADFLRALGHDPDSRPELSTTPERVVDAYLNDLLQGYAVDVRELLTRGLEPSTGLATTAVVIDNVRTTTLCPHHLMPASGTALVAYRPSKQLLGISTLSRLVDALARRLTLQEQITEGVTQALMDHIEAKGAYCELRLSHSCLSERGPRQHDAVIVTQSARGCFSEPQGMAELALLLKTKSEP